MNVCVPVLENRGLESELSVHFGSAPLFIVVDTETGQHRALENQDLHHSHGMCRPLASFEGEKIDALITGGIGRGALSRLRAGGLEVYCSNHKTVGEAIEALRVGQLGRVDPAVACGHHGHGQDSSCCSGDAAMS